MSHFNELLLKSLQSYQRLHAVTLELVALAEKSEQPVDAMVLEQYRLLQSASRGIDLELHAIATESNINANIDLWQRRKNQMQSILDYHRTMLPKLQSIMAMQQSDMDNVKRGMRGMSGYQSNNQHSGGRIKDAR